MGIQPTPSSQIAPQLTDQFSGLMLADMLVRVGVRVSAAVVFVLYTISGRHDLFSATAFNQIPQVLRWSLLFCIGWYGWWETSLQIQEAIRGTGRESGRTWFVRRKRARRMKSILLLPHTPEHLRTLLEGADTYQSRFQIKVAAGVGDFLAGPEVSAEFLERLNGPAAADPWKDGFAILHMADNTVIGLCSFTGPPSMDGVVEIAYGIAPGYQNRGHAREAAQELIAYAFADERVRTVRAHTLPQDSASTRVLTKCGFALIGEVTHGDDGVVWRWERQREAG
jgi:ribosomal-protein-alanine N-acetyltransferase